MPLLEYRPAVHVVRLPTPFAPIYRQPASLGLAKTIRLFHAYPASRTLQALWVEVPGYPLLTPFFAQEVYDWKFHALQFIPIYTLSIVEPKKKVPGSRCRKLRLLAWLRPVAV
jgi:hypothetical protein